MGFFLYITNYCLTKPFAQTSTSAFRKSPAAAFRVYINNQCFSMHHKAMYRKDPFIL